MGLELRARVGLEMRELLYRSVLLKVQFLASVIVGTVNWKAPPGVSKLRVTA